MGVCRGDAGLPVTGKDAGGPRVSSA